MGNRGWDFGNGLFFESWYLYIFRRLLVKVFWIDSKYSFVKK